MNTERHKSSKGIKSAVEELGIPTDGALDLASDVSTTIKDTVTQAGDRVGRLVEAIPQPISRSMHGVLDYAFVPMMAAAPHLLDFTDSPMPTNIARGVAATVLMQGMLTDAEWGLVKMIPYRRHLQADLAIGALSVAAPWVLGFAKNRAARNTFVAAGIITLVASMLSNGSESPVPHAELDSQVRH